MAFLAIYSGFGIAEAGANYTQAALGSLLWWFVLCRGVQVLQHKLSAGAMIWLNRLSGTILMLFALWAALSTT